MFVLHNYLGLPSDVRVFLTYSDISWDVPGTSWDVPSSNSYTPVVPGRGYPGMSLGLNSSPKLLLANINL